MDFNQVKELIGIINQSPLTEFKLKLDNAEIIMSKNAETRTNMNTVPINTPYIAPAITPNIEPIQEMITLPVSESKEIIKEGIVITSPIVGTYYESQSPEKPPFVKVGDKVKAGDVLCIIEAMKVMNEITAKTEGVIAEIMVTNEQMVEFNQPIIRIV